jgi:hypothetical protein
MTSKPYEALIRLRDAALAEAREYDTALAALRSQPLPTEPKPAKVPKAKPMKRVVSEATRAKMRAAHAARRLKAEAPAAAAE